jgi:lysophospholipase L1-like esterase
VFFRNSFDAPAGAKAVIEATADDAFELRLNGRLVGRGNSWQTLNRYDVTAILRSGRNQIAVRAVNNGGPAGLVLWTTVESGGKKSVVAATDGHWRSSVDAPHDWQSPEFNDAGWRGASVLGAFGEVGPWGKIHEAKRTVIASAPTKRTRSADATFVDGERIALIGSAFIERDGGEGFLETELVRRFPNCNLIIRNFGWSGDTVAGQARSYFGPPQEGFDRLADSLRAFSPTVVVASYGANESFAGEPGLAAFREGYSRLLGMLADETGAIVILLAPTPLEDRGPPLPPVAEQNRRIRLYRDAIREIARAHEAQFADLTSLIESAAISSRQTPVTSNGVHYTAYGYWRAAPLFADGLRARPNDWRLEIDIASQRIEGKGAAIAKPVFEGGAIRFEVTDRTLPKPPPPKDSPPDAEALSGRVVVATGLAPGRYTLRIDGVSVATTESTNWAAGVRVSRGPEFLQIERLRNAIVEKNATFFHEWRPQNETYLFGFRKHEQGVNAGEPSQFAPLVAKLDAQIHRLRAPVAHQYEIVPVNEDAK